MNHIDYVKMLERRKSLMDYRNIILDSENEEMTDE